MVPPEDIQSCDSRKKHPSCSSYMTVGMTQASKARADILLCQNTSSLKQMAKAHFPFTSGLQIEMTRIKITWRILAMSLFSYLSFFCFKS